MRARVRHRLGLLLRVQQYTKAWFCDFGPKFPPYPGPDLRGGGVEALRYQRNVKSTLQCAPTMVRNVPGALGLLLAPLRAGAGPGTKGGVAEAVQAQGYAASADTDNGPGGAILRNAGIAPSFEGPAVRVIIKSHAHH